MGVPRILKSHLNGVHARQVIHKLGFRAAAWLITVAKLPEGRGGSPCDHSIVCGHDSACRATSHGANLESGHESIIKKKTVISR